MDRAFKKINTFSVNFKAETEVTYFFLLSSLITDIQGEGTEGRNGCREAGGLSFVAHHPLGIQASSSSSWLQLSGSALRQQCRYRWRQLLSLIKPQMNLQRSKFVSSFMVSAWMLKTSANLSTGMKKGGIYVFQSTWFRGVRVIVRQGGISCSSS